MCPYGTPAPGPVSLLRLMAWEQQDIGSRNSGWEIGQLWSDSTGTQGRVRTYRVVQVCPYGTPAPGPVSFPQTMDQLLSGSSSRDGNQVMIGSTGTQG